MTESKDVPPDNVIALSRYRAQLGRGRKLRRSEALMDSPNPEAAIRALPGDELYYVVHEAGIRDAMEILVHASASQLQTIMDFAIWQRDELSPARLGEWLEILAEAPPEKIGEWIGGMDVELVGLLITTTTTIYDLSEGEPPDEPLGMFYPTPDRLFVLDVRGLQPEGQPGEGDGQGESSDGDGEREEDSAAADSARAVIRIIDNLYRSDRVLARRLLVAARGELPSTLQEMAYRWRNGRMADLGFADPWEALEVYRELDPATVRIGEPTDAATRVRPLHGDAKAGGDSLRAPLALVDRLGNVSPFARAVGALSSADQVAELHFALVTLSNRVLSADRVTPGDDEAVGAVLGRMLATLDIAVEFLAHGDDARGAEAVRTVSLVRLFRLGVSLIGKVRRLARSLERRGPFAALGPGLFEEIDAEVIAAVTRIRPDFPRILDTPPRSGDRPFASMADVARATAALREAGAAQAMLYALGVRVEHIGSDAVITGPGGRESSDAAAVDAGVLARTALVLRLLSDDSSVRGNPSMPFRPLSSDEVREFETLTRVPASDKDASKEFSTMKLNAKLSRKLKAILDAASPEGLVDAARKVAERWIAGLAPLEPVLVRRPAGKPTRRRR